MHVNQAIQNIAKQTCALVEQIQSHAIIAVSCHAHSYTDILLSK